MPGTGSRADVAERALRGRAVGFVLPVRYAGQCGSVRLATGRSSSPSVRVSVRTVRAQEPLSVFRRLDAFVGRVSRRVRRSEFSEHARRILPKALPVFGAVLLGACGYNEFGRPGDGRLAAPLPNLTVSSLRSLCADGPIRIEGSGARADRLCDNLRPGEQFLPQLFRRGSDRSARGAGRTVRPCTICTASGNRSRCAWTDCRRRSTTACSASGCGGRITSLCWIWRAGSLSQGMSFVPAGRSIPHRCPLAPSRFAEAKLGSLVRVAGLRMEPVRDTTWAVPARLSADGTPRTALLKFFTDGGDSLYVSTSGYASFARRYRSARAAGTDRYSASGQSRRQDGLRTQNEGSV